MFRSAKLLLVLTLALTACGKKDAGSDEGRGEAEANSGDQTKDGGGEIPAPRGLASAHGHFRVDVEWLAGPSFKTEDNRCRLVFFNAEGKPATDAVVLDFHPWMTSMGHGAPTIDQEIVLEDGRKDAFLVSGLMFTMGGPWDLKVDAKIDGVRDQASFAVDVPK